MVTTREAGGRDGIATFGRLAPLWLLLVLAGAGPALGAAPAGAVIATVELSEPFDTRSRWSFVASQDPDMVDPQGIGGQMAPGAVHPCLRAEASGACDTGLKATIGDVSKDDFFSEPHYLGTARIVHPRGNAGRPVLLVQMSSLHAGDGDQVMYTQALAYQRDADRFVRVFGHLNDRNNNQDVRYIETGPLQGDIVTAEPTQTAPFGYWISLNTISPGQGYRETLRYRSATTYNDGNPLPVIDSEMPNIEQRLHLWRPGQPLPGPPGSCPKPHLVRGALWCS